MKILGWTFLAWQFYPSFSLSVSNYKDEDFGWTERIVCIGPIQTRWCKL